MIKEQIAGFEKDEAQMENELAKLQEWTEEDCLDIYTQKEKIRMVQAFKDKLDAKMKALKAEHDNIRALQEELAKQNLE